MSDAAAPKGNFVDKTLTCKVWIVYNLKKNCLFFIPHRIAMPNGPSVLENKNFILKRNLKMNQLDARLAEKQEKLLEAVN
jgi:hypothetical protein